ncbi:MAG TPA: RNA polymerase sigma factor [Longimicrobium sp.]|nr:RNA polymerase sigma factor [Longimicrobium sp.]
MKDTESGDLGELAERAAGGCTDAMEALLGRLVGPVRDFHVSWLGSRRDARDTAQDLAQETLLRVMRGIQTCRARTERQVMSWALAIARNVALDHAKSERRRRAQYSTSPDLEEVAAGPSVSAWAAEHAEPDPRRASLRGVLAAGLAAAPETLHEILWIRVVEGGTWRDTAGDMRMTLRAVQRRFQRFGESLRAQVPVHPDPNPERPSPP